jgi:hypothetical protein
VAQLFHSSGLLAAPHFYDGPSVFAASAQQTLRRVTQVFLRVPRLPHTGHFQFLMDGESSKVIWHGKFLVEMLIEFGFVDSQDHPSVVLDDCISTWRAP